MTAKYFENANFNTDIKQVRVTPKNLEIQVAKLDSFIKTANCLLNKAKNDSIKIKQSKL